MFVSAYGQGASYGNGTQPTGLGSGGGRYTTVTTVCPALTSSSNDQGLGGAGGGAVHLIAKYLSLLGTISADGAPGRATLYGFSHSMLRWSFSKQKFWRRKRLAGFDTTLTFCQVAAFGLRPRLSMVAELSAQLVATEEALEEEEEVVTVDSSLVLILLIRRKNSHLCKVTFASIPTHSAQHNFSIFEVHNTRTKRCSRQWLLFFQP